MAKTLNVRMERETHDAAALIATASLGRRPKNSAEMLATVVSVASPERLELLAERINADLRSTTVATALHIGGLFGAEYAFDLREGWSLLLPDGETLISLGHADVGAVTTLLARRGVELGLPADSTD